MRNQTKQHTWQQITSVTFLPKMRSAPSHWEEEPGCLLAHHKALRQVRYASHSLKQLKLEVASYIEHVLNHIATADTLEKTRTTLAVECATRESFKKVIEYS